MPCSRPIHCQDQKRGDCLSGVFYVLHIIRTEKNQKENVFVAERIKRK